jgi:excisionase family DNA binding protein
MEIVNLTSLQQRQAVGGTYAEITYADVTSQYQINLKDSSRDDYINEWSEICDTSLAEAVKLAEGLLLDYDDDNRVMVVDVNRRDVPDFTPLYAVLTTSEVAELYGLDDSTPKKAAQEGAIPARKSGGTWLIRREDAEARWGKRK